MKLEKINKMGETKSEKKTKMLVTGVGLDRFCINPVGGSDT